MRSGLLLLLAIAVLCAVVSVSGADGSSRVRRRTRARTPWYQSITTAHEASAGYCGMNTKTLRDAAWKEFEAAFTKAFGSTDTTKVCGSGKKAGGYTAAELFEELKAGQLQAKAAKNPKKPPPGTFKIYEDLAQACKAELATSVHSNVKGFGLWSGGIGCSHIATKMGVTTMEHTKLGSILTAVFTYPTASYEALLLPEWKTCMNKLWNAFSEVYVNGFVGPVTIFIRAAQSDSVLWRKELPALQKLFDKGVVTTVTFEVCKPDEADGSCPRDPLYPKLRRNVGLPGKPGVVQERDLIAILKQVASKANRLQPDSVRIDEPATNSTATAKSGGKKRKVIAAKRTGKGTRKAVKTRGKTARKAVKRNAKNNKNK